MHRNGPEKPPQMLNMVVAKDPQGKKENVGSTAEAKSWKSRFAAFGSCSNDQSKDMAYKDIVRR